MNLLEIYEKKYKSFVHTAAKIVGPNDAEDVVQNAFIKLALYYADIAIDESTAYLHRCVRNAAYDFIRDANRQKRDQRLSHSLEQLALAIEIGADFSPSDHQIAKPSDLQTSFTVEQIVEARLELQMIFNLPLTDRERIGLTRKVLGYSLSKRDNSGVRYALGKYRNAAAAASADS